MTKRILLIDDLRNFRQAPEGDLTIARTSVEALRILATENTWDEIWFDHDLGKPNGVDIDDTMYVVDYMCEKAFYNAPVQVGLCVIHTSNSVGSNNIKVSLERFGYATKRVAAEPIFIVD